MFSFCQCDKIRDRVDNKILFKASKPQVSFRNGDLSKRWFVFYYEHRETGVIRKKIYSDDLLNRKFGQSGNSIKSKRLRCRYFNELLVIVQEKIRNQSKGIDTMRKVTIKRVLEIAIEKKKEKTNTRTYKSYKYRKRHFEAWLRKRQLSQSDIRGITNKLVRQYFKTVKGRTPINELKSIFSELVNDGIIPVNPAKGIQAAKSVVTKNRIYTAAEAKEILNWTKENDPKLYLCLLLEYYCMIRPIEVLRLKKNNICLVNRTITITALENQKSKRSRTLRINQQIIDAINSISNQESDYLLGRVYNDEYFKKKFQRHKKNKRFKVPKGCTMYSFKHTGAVALYNATKDILIVKKYCGHSKVETTMNYLRDYGCMLELEGENLVPIL